MEMPNSLSSMTESMQSQKIDETINAVLERVRSGEALVLLSQESQRINKRKIQKVKKPVFKKEEKITFLRGKRLFEICQQYPFLEKNAGSRKPEVNAERNRMWQEIAEQINTEFKDMEHFEKMDIYKIRKYEDYYKKRCQPDAPFPADLMSVIGPDTVFPPPLSDVHRLGLAISMKKIVKKRETNQKDVDLEKLRSERLHFLITLIREVMRATKLDQSNQGRSSDTNLRRLVMWKYITTAVNYRYRGRIEPMKEAQVKKSYSNYKRRHPHLFEPTSVDISADAEVFDENPTEIEVQVRGIEGFIRHFEQE